MYVWAQWRGILANPCAVIFVSCCKILGYAGGTPYLHGCYIYQALLHAVYTLYIYRYNSIFVKMAFTTRLESLLRLNRPDTQNFIMGW